MKMNSDYMNSDERPSRPIKTKSFEQWLAAKPARSKLTKNEAKQRYNDYLRSTAMRKAPGQNKINKTKRSSPGELSYSTMSESTTLYAYALVDPWDCPDGPSLPDAITLPSYKFSSRCRSKMYVGTAGSGFSAVSPYTPWGDDAGPAFVYNSAANWNGNSLHLDVSVSLNQVSLAYGTSPFKFAQFSPEESNRGVGLQYRTVACGIAIRYIGPELTRSGRVIEYRQPTNASIYGTPITVDQMLLNRETEPGPVDREWHYAVWRPAIPTDLTYGTYSGLPSVCLLVFVEGAPVGSAFEVDAIAHFECVGASLPNKTKSYHDPVGMAVISSALPSHQPYGTPKENWKDFASEIFSTAKTALSYAPTVIEGITTLSSLL